MKLTELSFDAMGTHAHVVIGDGEPRHAAMALEGVDRLERLWSRFIADSEISRANASPGEPIAASPETIELVERAVQAWELTGGLFDPTVLGDLVELGYDRTFRELETLPPQDPAEAGLQAAGARGRPEVTVDRGSSTITVGDRGIDSGGIGKGLAADLAVRELLGAGVESAAVSVGGDVRVAGRVPDGGWRIPVADAFSDGWARTVVLDAGGVATSSTQVRRWPDEAGGWIHHLVDPTTGCPSNSGVRSVTVAADEAWWAEVLAKAALVAGPERGGELIERAGAVGWCSADDGGEIRVGVPVRPGDACRWETDRGPDRSEVAPTRPDRTGSGRGAPG